MTHSSPLSALVFSGDGRTLYSGGTDGALHAWNAESGTHLREFVGHERSVLHLALSLNGDEMLSASRDSTLRCWSTTTGEIQRTLTPHTAGVYSAFIDGALGIVSSSYDGTIRTSGSSLVLEGHTAAVTGVLRFGPCFVSASRDGTLRRWDATSGRLVAERRAH